ncbi:MAG: hypothetical protein KAQ62_15085 [Cyclobacteriaceae bacterium]|nr:hypothetical protein [Cyclobacteriaceae bacterium]MCK5369883.1 hypothetical protein [Cyclobacteriaceae bacterium]MCK5471361.1 hypothetical protein [Cyclobacteriaceae bacterium]
MDYHLKPIEQFISNYLTPDNTFVDRVHEVILDSLLIMLGTQFERIKGQISESYYSFDEERISTYFIQNHQHKIVIMTNQISLNLSQENGSAAEAKKTIQNSLITRLSALLKFLETEYAHCLDASYYITSAFGNEKAFEYSKFLATLENPFYHADTLVKIALEPINTFIHNDKTTYTYEKIKYFDKLVKELKRLHRKADMGLKKDLVGLMIFINFNNTDFLIYLTSMILDQVSRMGSVEEQLIKLKWHQKQYRQRQSKTDMAFLVNRRNIKDQVTRWISEEIKFLESSKQPISLKNHEEGNTLEDAKLQLDLTVDQIAVLVRIAKESGILKNEELNPVARLISKFVSTKRQSTISSANLYNCIYKIEIENPDALKAKITGWLNEFL